MFGAKGDGVTNDSTALAELSKVVNANRGGTVELGAGKTYLVGRQSRGPQGGRFSRQPATLLRFSECTGPLTIHGNGARLKCTPRLRYRTFGRITGAQRAIRCPM